MSQSDSPETTWNKAIIAILEEAQSAMHYTDIAEAITSRKLRKNIGAKPAYTVSERITSDIKKYGAQSKYRRVAPGMYMLNSLQLLTNTEVDGPDASRSSDPVDANEVLTAFGMYWRRDLVNWNSNPKILGQQQKGATRVDFSEQNGVYALHDSRDIVYVGRAIDSNLGKRLSFHTTDRMNGRWDRFSWFGVLPIDDSGKTAKDRSDLLPSGAIVSAMEALLIEVIEPPLNRKRGDDLRAVEYLQVEDEKVRKQRYETLLYELQSKLHSE